MEQAADGAETADSFRRDLKTFLFNPVRIRIDSVMHLRSSSRGRNASVTVTVTDKKEALLSQRGQRVGRA